MLLFLVNNIIYKHIGSVYFVGTSYFVKKRQFLYFELFENN